MTAWKTHIKEHKDKALTKVRVYQLIEEHKNSRQDVDDHWGCTSHWTSTENIVTFEALVDEDSWCKVDELTELTRPSQARSAQPRRRTWTLCGAFISWAQDFTFANGEVLHQAPQPMWSRSSITLDEMWACRYRVTAYPGYTFWSEGLSSGQLTL